MKPKQDPTLRFSDRVDDYQKYRPGYPPEMIEFIRQDLSFGPGLVAADVGSGTGILTLLLLAGGNLIYAVEPNDPMRKAAEERLSRFTNFRSVSGRAEATGLPSASVDFVFVAQAFHWFDKPKARVEFQRILKPRGLLCVIWNLRVDDSSEFARGYEDLLMKFGVEYAQIKVGWVNETPVMKRFFEGDGQSGEVTAPGVGAGAGVGKGAAANAPGKFMGMKRFVQVDRLTLEAMRGRLHSTSYCPKPGTPGYDEIMRGIDELFARTQVGGYIEMEYETVLYYGTL